MTALNTTLESASPSAILPPMQAASITTPSPGQPRTGETMPDHPGSSDAVPDVAQGSTLVRVLLLGGAAFLLGTGLLLWMREGDRLFTEGLIAAIAGCF